MTPRDPGSSMYAGSFHTTRWSRVGPAKADSDDGRRALSDLCQDYYEPVVAFLRWELRDVDAAREMGHAFFAEMLEGGAIAAAEPGRGRFRSYLLGAVKHFLSHHREAARRQKRGGGAAHLSLDEDVSAAREIADPTQISPDAAFDRQWALTTLARAMEAVKSECEAERKNPRHTGVRFGFAFPVRVQGSYRIEVEFTKHGPNGTVCLLLSRFRAVAGHRTQGPAPHLRPGG